MTSKPYHHGDLRAALLRAGMELLATRKADDLSLREIARAVGVSANAVYRHFADKESLLQALAAEGLRLLYVDQREASERAGGGVDGFKATGAAYVRFALRRPALFRQIFSTPPLALPMAEMEHVADAYALLRANAAQVTTSDEELQVVALEAWSLAHGVAMLMLDSQVHVSDAMIDNVFTHWGKGLTLRHPPQARAAPPRPRPRGLRAGA